MVRDRLAHPAGLVVLPAVRAVLRPRRRPARLRRALQPRLPAAAAPAAAGQAAAAPRPAGAAGLVRPGGGGPPVGVSTHPRAYEVHVSLDGQAWGLPVATGKGAPGSTTIVLERPVRARYIRITQTGTDETAPAWSVARLQVYGPPAPASPAAKPSAP